MGTSETLPSAGSDLSDEALLTGTESPTEPEAEPIEQGEPPLESPPAQVPEAEGGPEAEGELAPDGEEEADSDLAAKPEGEAEAEAVVEEPFAEREVPADIKAMFQQEGVGSKIRDLYFRDQAYREVYSTVAEAREVKELLPDGVKSAQELLAVAERIEPFEEAFSNAAKDGPGAVEFWQRIYDTDQQAYHHLHTQAVENVIHHLKAQADKSGDENLIAAADVMWRRLNGGEPYQARSTEPGDNLRENALFEREQALEAKELSGFKHTAFIETESQVQGAITTHVQTVLKNSNVPRGAQKRIIDDIHEEIRTKISANPTLQTQLNRAFRNGDKGQKHIQSITSIVVNRAKNLIPETSRGIIKEWTGVYLANHGAVKLRQQTSHADVGAGGPAGQPNLGLPKSKDIDYSQMSDEELLTAREIPLKQR